MGQPPSDGRVVVIGEFEVTARRDHIGLVDAKAECPSHHHSDEGGDED
jgi:hypothetical protein